MKTTWVTREELIEAAKGYLDEVDVVLDIGPGIHPQSFIKPSMHICVEPHRPYIEHLRQELGNDPRYIFLNGSWDVALKLLLPKSVDTVFAVDVIEHMEKADGFELLREAERLARRQVVIFTPLGFFPQPYENPEKPDRWGMNGGYWQAHRSGWLPEDFGEGWEFICSDSFHLVDHNEQPLEGPFGAFWAIRNLSRSKSRSKGRHPVGRQSKRNGRAWLKHKLDQVLPASASAGLRSVWHAAKSRPR